MDSEKSRRQLRKRKTDVVREMRSDPLFMNTREKELQRAIKEMKKVKRGQSKKKKTNVGRKKKVDHDWDWEDICRIELRRLNNHHHYPLKKCWDEIPDKRIVLGLLSGHMITPIHVVKRVLKIDDQELVPSQNLTTTEESAHNFSNGEYALNAAEKDKNKSLNTCDDEELESSQNLTMTEERAQNYSNGEYALNATEKDKNKSLNTCDDEELESSQNLTMTEERAQNYSNGEYALNAAEKVNNKKSLNTCDNEELVSSQNLTMTEECAQNFSNGEYALDATENIKKKSLNTYDTNTSQNKYKALDNSIVIVKEPNYSFPVQKENVRPINFLNKSSIKCSTEMQTNQLCKEVNNSDVIKASRRKIAGNRFGKKTIGFKQNMDLLPTDPNLFGLPNPGTNRCWFNASMQVIFGLHSFVKDFKYSFRDTEDSICNLFLKLLKCRQQGDKKQFIDTARKMSDNLYVLETVYKSNSQQDSGEFMSKFFNYIKLKCVFFADPVVNNIEFTTVETSTCRCGEKNSYQVGNILFLSIISELEEYYSSVQEAVDGYFKRKVLVKDCINCRHIAFTKSTLKKVSRYLCIQLMRYNTKGEKIVKIDFPIIVDRVLSLNNCVNQDLVSVDLSASLTNINEMGELMQNTINIDKDSNKKDSFSKNTFQYRLVGIIYHVGSTPDSGHYTCDVFQAGSWYHYDDLRVTKLSTPKQNKCAYIVIYENISLTDTVGIESLVSMEQRCDTSSDE